jgi:hypothetical protein
MGGETPVAQYLGLTEETPTSAANLWLSQEFEDVRFARQTNCVAEVATELAAGGMNLRPVYELLWAASPRCGITETRNLTVSIRRVRNRGADNPADAYPLGGSSVEEHFRQSLAEATDPKTPALWGAVHARTNETYITVALVIYQPEATMDPILYDQSGQSGVWLRGTLWGDPRQLEAVVTDGPWDAQPCERDTRVEFPAFSAWCPLNPDDDRTWITVTVWQANEIGRPAITLELSPRGSTNSAELLSEHEACESHDAAEFMSGQDIANLLSLLRAELGRDPLRFDAERNAPFERVVDIKLFGESFEERRVVESMLLNGLELERPLVDSMNLSRRLPFRNVCSAFLSELRRSPRTRLFALGESTHEIIVATSVSDEKFGWMIGLYSTLLEDDASRERHTLNFVHRVARFREALGLAEQRAVSPEVGRLLHVIVRELDAGSIRTAPDAADIANEVLRRYGGSLQVHALTAENPMIEELPSVLLARRLRFVSVVLGRRTRQFGNQDQDGGGYIILILTDRR